MTLSLSTRGYLCGPGRLVRRPRGSAGSVSAVSIGNVVSVTLTAKPAGTEAPPPVTIPQRPSITAVVDPAVHNVTLTAANPIEVVTSSTPASRPSLTVSCAAKTVVTLTRE